MIFFHMVGKSGGVGQLCMLYCITSSSLLKGATGSIPKGSQGNTEQWNLHHFDGFFGKLLFSCPRCNTKLLWQNQQATLHPFAVYHNDDEGKLKFDCYCVISDHLLHNQTAVHCFILLVILTIHRRNPRIK